MLASGVIARAIDGRFGRENNVYGLSKHYLWTKNVAAASMPAGEAVGGAHISANSLYFQYVPVRIKAFPYTNQRDFKAESRFFAMCHVFSENRIL